jgi:hypothetical protein
MHWNIIDDSLINQNLGVKWITMCIFKEILENLYKNLYICIFTYLQTNQLIISKKSMNKLFDHFIILFVQIKC